MNTKTREVEETNRNAHKQLMEVLVEKCGARGLAECEGPNGSILRFWNVNGCVVITQEYTNGHGWEYYLSGRKHMVAEIPADIQQATSDKSLADELLEALKGIEPDLAWGTTGRYKGEGSDAIRALIAKAEGRA